MNEEEAVGIVALLHFQQTLEIGAPKTTLPLSIEKLPSEM
jgi:hypothetical protein